VSATPVRLNGQTVPEADQCALAYEKTRPARVPAPKDKPRKGYAAHLCHSGRVELGRSRSANSDTRQGNDSRPLFPEMVGLGGHHLRPGRADDNALKIIVDGRPMIALGDRRDIAVGPHEPDAMLGIGRTDFRLQQLGVAGE
jgi:hypothetical protein